MDKWLIHTKSWAQLLKKYNHCSNITKTYKNRPKIPHIPFHLVSTISHLHPHVTFLYITTHTHTLPLSIRHTNSLFKPRQSPLSYFSNRQRIIWNWDPYSDKQRLIWGCIGATGSCWDAAGLARRRWRSFWRRWGRWKGLSWRWRD